MRWCWLTIPQLQKFMEKQIQNFCEIVHRCKILEQNKCKILTLKICISKFGIMSTKNSKTIVQHTRYIFSNKITNWLIGSIEMYVYGLKLTVKQHNIYVICIFKMKSHTNNVIYSTINGVTQLLNVQYHMQMSWNWLWRNMVIRNVIWQELTRKNQKLMLCKDYITTKKPWEKRNCI